MQALIDQIISVFDSAAPLQRTSRASSGWATGCGSFEQGRCRILTYSRVMVGRLLLFAILAANIFGKSTI